MVLGSWRFRWVLGCGLVLFVLVCDLRGGIYGLWFAGLGVLQWFLGWICLGFVDVGFLLFD